MAVTGSDRWGLERSAAGGETGRFAASSSSPARRRLGRWVRPALGLTLFALGLGSLGHQLRGHPLPDLMAGLAQIPAPRIAWALGLCAVNYAVLVGYDRLALRYIGHALPLKRIALAAFVASSLSNNIGFSMLSGGSVRYRLYTAFGLSALDTTRIVAFVLGSFWLGFLVVAGLVFALDAPSTANLALLRGPAVPWLGALFLAVWAAYVVLALTARRPWRLMGIALAPPSPPLLAEQTLIACLDWLSVGALLYVLLPAGSLSFPAFIGAYLLALLVGLASQVPGALGVFDSVLVLLLVPAVPAAQLAASLLAYRLIYYLLPLALALALLGAHEVALRRRHLERLTVAMGRWASPLVPLALALAVFGSGLTLLLSNATPELHGRLRWLDTRLPLAFIESAHWLLALVGAQLLLLARPLQRRLARAWTLGLALLPLGVGLCLLKGLDWEEGLLLAAVFAVLAVSRREFYRQAGLLQEPFAAGWAVAVALALLASVALGAFAYQHLDYHHDLWWSFATTGDAARFLRGSVGALAVALFFALAHFVSPHPLAPGRPSPADLERAARVVAQSPETYASLALLGDKALLFDEAGQAFLMFARQGRCFVAMGDPVGPPPAQRELAWRLRELADRADAYTVFYEVGPPTLPLYLDMGLSLQKLGEEALVPLPQFSLEGRGMKGLRSTCHRLERAGYRFELLPAQAVRGELPELKAISDAWLAEKQTREKGFSLGYFDADYLARFPLARVRQGDRTVAFANLWTSAGRAELSVDLMRHLPEAHGVMDFLFAQLMLWGRTAGYQSFNLGMAPLSGLEERPLAPAWSRLAAVLYRHGEQLYNFQGLRSYKEKFHPRWQPRYLASPRGFALPFVLTSVAALVSRGLKGVSSR